MPSSNAIWACATERNRGTASREFVIWGWRRLVSLGVAGWLTGAVITLGPGALAAETGEPSLGARHYRGCCDASAAALVTETLFAVASDEDNRLRLYRTDAEGPPVATVDLTAFLGARRGNEADFEAAARLGDLIFWMGSHARNQDGKARPGRQVLVATAIRGTGLTATLEPVGRPVRDLAMALASDPALKEFQFAAAAGRPAEAPGGLNLEGLAAGPDDSLWLGFRNPVPGGRALVVPLLNPRGAIDGERPRLGAALRLDLGGLGIRDFARAGDEYLLIAGPAEGGGRHHLYPWDGISPAPTRSAGVIPKGLQAEAVLVLPGAARTAMLLSDDGKEKLDGRRCEELTDPGLRRFRALRIAY